MLPALRRFTGWMPSIKRFDSLTRRANELMFELVAERRAAEQAGEPLGDDILAMLLQARHEDGSPMSAQRASRRADDGAGRRPRDDGVAAGLGV